MASITSTVDEAAFRPVHAWLFLAAVGGTLLDGVSVFMTGLAVPLLRAQFAMGPLEVGLLGSALVLGAVFGAVLGGHLADRLGRKDVFLGDMALLAVAALVLVLAELDRLGAGRPVLVGVAIGMDFPAASAYVAETMPVAERQKMVVGTITFQAVGMVLAAGLGLWLLRAVGLRRGLALAVRLARRPRDAVLRCCGWPSPRARTGWRPTGIPPRRPASWRVSASTPARRGRVGGPRPGETGAPPPRGFGALFAPAFLRLTMLTAGAWFLMDIATYGVGIFTPVILQSLDPPRARTARWSCASSMSAGPAGSSTCSCSWAS